MSDGRRPAKVQRWVDLIAALLRFHYPVGFDTLERDVPAYGASRRQRDALMRMFERDKDELRALGVPIESVSGEDGMPDRYLLRARDFYLPYVAVVDGGAPSAVRRPRGYGYQALRSLAFLPDELELVVQAGRRVQQLGDTTLSDDARSALRKLAFDLTVADHQSREVVAAETAHAEVLARLDGAVRARKMVSFHYRSMRSGETTMRSVEPYGLVFVAGAWYLIGHDLGVHALRQFRVRRIYRARMNGSLPHMPDFAIPRDFRLGDYAESRTAWELGDADALDAIVEFRTASAAAREAMLLGEPVRQARSRPDPSVRQDARARPPERRIVRRYRVRRVDAFARWLLSYADCARPVSPPQVVAAWRDLAERTAALYAEGR